MPDADTISADYTLRPGELAETLALLVEARQPTLVWGAPGSAKSDIARRSPPPPDAGTSTSAHCCSILSTCAASPGATAT